MFNSFDQRQEVRTNGLGATFSPSAPIVYFVVECLDTVGGLPYVLQGTIRVSECFSHGSADNALELIARLSQPFERHKKSDCIAAHAARGGEQIVAVMEQCPYLTSHRHQRLRLAG